MLENNHIYLFTLKEYIWTKNNNFFFLFWKKFGEDNLWSLFELELDLVLPFFEILTPGDLNLPRVKLFSRNWLHGPQRGLLFFVRAKIVKIRPNFGFRAINKKFSRKNYIASHFFIQIYKVRKNWIVVFWYKKQKSILKAWRWDLRGITVLLLCRFSKLQTFSSVK